MPKKYLFLMQIFLANFHYKKLEYYKKHGKEETIATTKVKDPSRFGVIVTDENDKILLIVEKPKYFIGDKINAGLFFQINF